MLTKLTFIK